MHGEATIHRHATILRRGLRGIISLLVACTVAAFVISGLSPRIYEAKATILVGPVLSTAEPDLNRLLAAQRLAVTYAELAVTRPFLQDVRDALGLDDAVESITGRLIAQAPADSTFITVTFSDEDPNRAATIANAVAATLVAKAPDATGSGTTNGGGDAKLLTIVEPAIAPDKPTSPRVLFNVAVTAVVGLLLGIALAYGRAWYRDEVDGREDAESIIGAPNLGEVEPGNSEAKLAETIARLAQRIDIVDRHPSRQLVVGFGESPAWLGTALARWLSRLGRQSLLVRLDAASRTPVSSGFERLLSGAEPDARSLVRPAALRISGRWDQGRISRQRLRSHRPIRRNWRCGR